MSNKMVNTTSNTANTTRRTFIAHTTGKEYAKYGPEEIRQSRASTGALENVVATADRLGTTKGEVHRACCIDVLTSYERDAIVYEFLGGKPQRNIAIERGLLLSAVIEAVRLDLIRSRIEAALRVPEGAVERKGADEVRA